MGNKKQNYLTSNKTSKNNDSEGDQQLNQSSEKSQIIQYLKKSQEENIKLTDKIENLEKAQDIIFDQFRTLELQRADLEKQQRKLEEASEKFRGRTIELFGKMIDLKKAKEELIKKLNEYKGFPQIEELPTAPRRFIKYVSDNNRPQVKIYVDFEKGMGITV